MSYAAPRSAPGIGAISLTASVTAFFGVGLLMMLGEAVFFASVRELSSSPFTTRSVIGFHMFPSELWFMVLGNAFTVLLLTRERFMFPAKVLDAVKPVLLVCAVYTLWFGYGVIRGNGWALQEFREMVFSAISLPPFLYLARFVDIGRLVHRYFILPALFLIPAMSVYGLVTASFGMANVSLVIATLVVAYYSFAWLNGNARAFPAIILICLPFLISFAKPMIALLGFVLLISLVLAGHFNRVSVAWVLSRFKLKITAMVLFAIVLMIVVAFVINWYYDGIIEHAIRFYFLKIRLTESGELIQGDISGGRIAIWGAALSDWIERPWFGYGLGASVEGIASGWFVKVQFHNYPVQLLHHTGIVGATVAIIAVVVWLRNVARRIAAIKSHEARLIPATLFIYVLGIGFFGLYGHSLTYPPSTLLLWMCVGFLCVLPWERQQ